MNLNPNLLIYKKITNKFLLTEKNYLYLGSYLISMEVCLSNKIQSENTENNYLINNNKNPKIIDHINSLKRYYIQKL